MKKILLLKPFMQTLAQGKTFTKFFFWFLRIIAALTLLGFIYVSVELWTNVPFSNVEGKVIVLALLAQILLAILVFVVCNILLVRADDFNAMNTSLDYILIPITIKFIRLSGEILGAFYAFIGIVTGIAILTLGPLMKSLPSIPGMDLFSGNGGIIGGIIAIVGGPAVGFIMLCVHYLFAEIFQVLVDYFRNTRR
ncbi:MAG TPA: hypothetical protein PK514_14325 [Spirochaetota bacterium]|nr:hypothetical protein [Spirochaetota bacterium]